MIISLLCATCVGVLIIYACYCHFHPSVTILNKLPGPKAWPLIGNTLDLIVTPEKIFELIRKWTVQYGDIVHIWALHIHAVLINNPADVEKLLSTSKYNEKGIPYNFIRPWLTEGIVVSNGMLLIFKSNLKWVGSIYNLGIDLYLMIAWLEGPKWHQRRKMMTPSFHFEILKQFLKSFVEQTNCLVAKLELEVGKDRTNLVQPITKTTLNVMCQTAMGITDKNKTKTKMDDYTKSVHVFGECLIYRVTRIWQHFDIVYFFSPNKLKRDNAVTKLHKFTDQIIEERITDKENADFSDIGSKINDGVYGEKRMAMLDLLLRDESKGSLDRLGVREEVDSFMFAGHDTTAMALSFFFLRIAFETECQVRVYEEMSKIFDDDVREPTVEDLKAMTYLECCIKESLRLYPSAPLIVRQLKEDVELTNGYKIPKGTACGINIYDIHRRGDIYPEPEKFIPERFLPENTCDRHKYAFLPFSAGPRNCIGQRFAMMMMKTIISGVLRRFTMEPVTKLEDLKLRTDLVLRSSKPYYVRVQRRDREVKNQGLN